MKKTVIERDGKHYLVSTVLLTVALPGDSQFETMVFECEGDGAVDDWYELYCDRYATSADALRGHQHVVLNFQPGDER